MPPPQVCLSPILKVLNAVKCSGCPKTIEGGATCYLAPYDESATGAVRYSCKACRTKALKGRGKIAKADALLFEERQARELEYECTVECLECKGTFHSACAMFNACTAARARSKNEVRTLLSAPQANWTVPYTERCGPLLTAVVAGPGNS